MKKKIVKEFEPDVVDKIFEYAIHEMGQFKDLTEEEIDKLKIEVREEFSGKHYVRSAEKKINDRIGSRVLAMFNGRNVKELARKFDVSPASIRRIIRQSGDVKPLSKSILP